MFTVNAKCLYVISVAGSDASEPGTGDKKRIFSFALKSSQTAKMILWGWFFFGVIWEFKPFKLFFHKREKMKIQVFRILALLTFSLGQRDQSSWSLFIMAKQINVYMLTRKTEKPVLKKIFCVLEYP